MRVHIERTRLLTWATIADLGVLEIWLHWLRADHPSDTL